MQGGGIAAYLSPYVLGPVCTMDGKFSGLRQREVDAQGEERDQPAEEDDERRCQGAVAGGGAADRRQPEEHREVDQGVAGDRLQRAGAERDGDGEQRVGGVRPLAAEKERAAGGDHQDGGGDVQGDEVTRFADDETGRGNGCAYGGTAAPESLRVDEGERISGPRVEIGDNGHQSERHQQNPEELLRRTFVALEWEQEKCGKQADADDSRCRAQAAEEAGGPPSTSCGGEKCSGGEEQEERLCHRERKEVAGGEEGDVPDCALDLVIRHPE